MCLHKCPAGLIDKAATSREQNGTDRPLSVPASGEGPPLQGRPDVEETRVEIRCRDDIAASGFFWVRI